MSKDKEVVVELNANNGNNSQETKNSNQQISTEKNSDSCAQYFCAIKYYKSETRQSRLALMEEIKDAPETNDFVTNLTDNNGHGLVFVQKHIGASAFLSTIKNKKRVSKKYLTAYIDFLKDNYYKKQLYLYIKNENNFDNVKVFLYLLFEEEYLLDLITQKYKSICGIFSETVQAYQKAISEISNYNSEGLDEKKNELGRFKTALNNVIDQKKKFEINEKKLTDFDKIKKNIEVINSGSKIIFLDNFDLALCEFFEKNNINDISEKRDKIVVKMIELNETRGEPLSCVITLRKRNISESKDEYKKRSESIYGNISLRCAWSSLSEELSKALFIKVLKKTKRINHNSCKCSCESCECTYKFDISEIENICKDKQYKDIRQLINVLDVSPNGNPFYIMRPMMVLAGELSNNMQNGSECTILKNAEGAVKKFFKEEWNIQQNLNQKCFAEKSCWDDFLKTLPLYLPNVEYSAGEIKKIKNLAEEIYCELINASDELGVVTFSSISSAGKRFYENEEYRKYKSYIEFCLLDNFAIYETPEQRIKNMSGGCTPEYTINDFVKYVYSEENDKNLFFHKGEKKL